MYLIVNLVNLMYQILLVVFDDHWTEDCQYDVVSGYIPFEIRYLECG